jgi:hypothetical protein
MSNIDIVRKVYQEVKLDLKKNKFEQAQLEAYPWDECVADQVARYGDEETAKKVCGAIKAGMKKSFAEGDSLEGACWPGYEAIGLKDVDGRLVPNCVPVKEMSKVKEGFPVPSPSGNEDENAFISRCMSEIGNEYDQEQALAICYSKWKGE